MVKKVMEQRSWSVIGFSVLVACIAPLFFLDSGLRGWGTFWAFVAAITGTIFVAAYGLLANWRRNPDGTRNNAGQHLMAFSAAISIIMWFVVASTFGLVPPAWLPYLRASIYTVIALLMVWRLVLLVTIQVRARRKRKSQRAAR